MFELFVDEEPALGEDAMQAVRAWKFCDGWHPERLPIYAAFHDVHDWDLLLDLLMEIRAHV